MWHPSIANPFSSSHSFPTLFNIERIITKVNAKIQSKIPKESHSYQNDETILYNYVRHQTLVDSSSNKTIQLTKWEEM